MKWCWLNWVKALNPSAVLQWLLKKVLRFWHYVVRENLLPGNIGWTLISSVVFSVNFRFKAERFNLCSSLSHLNRCVSEWYQKWKSEIDLITSICGLRMAPSDYQNWITQSLYLFLRSKNRTKRWSFKLVFILAIIGAIRLSKSKWGEVFDQNYRGHVCFSVQRQSNDIRFCSLINCVLKCKAVWLMICEQVREL